MKLFQVPFHCNGIAEILADDREDAIYKVGEIILDLAEDSGRIWFEMQDVGTDPNHPSLMEVDHS